VAFLAYDLGKLSVALYTGVGIGPAALDVAWSVIGVASPIPGTGQVLKASRVVVNGVELARTADKVIDTPRSAEETARLAHKYGEAARASERVAEKIGILRDAARQKGNFGLGSGTAEEAMELGVEWVGKGYRVASDGKTLVSADKLRQFRPPSFKPNLGKVQANFEGRTLPEDSWTSNGHFDIMKDFFQ
jgi:hypothetical protein